VGYILRQLSRAFSSNERFTEMINVTGPRNSGKSFIVMLVSKFLGDGHSNYMGTLDKEYLSKPPGRASSNADSGRNPALAQNRNKRMTVIPDSPDGFFRSDVMKPLLE
jgi:phage/plasmid-associated DNA primase